MNKSTSEISIAAGHRKELFKKSLHLPKTTICNHCGATSFNQKAGDPCYYCIDGKMQNFKPLY